MGSLFLGSFAHTLDDKGRLTVPAPFRERLETGAVVTKGIVEPCLSMYVPAVFEQVGAKIETLDKSQVPIRDLRRLVFGGARDLMPDRQGRVVLPEELRKYANLEKQVMIVGVGDHCEIWDADTWEMRQSKKLDDPEWRAEQLPHLDL